MGEPVYLKVEKVIHQPIERVWNTVALGFGDVASYNPAIKHSKLESPQKSGVGMKRRCEFADKGYIREEIVEWSDLRSFKLRFTESSVPMAFMESQFSFKAENNQTRITQEFWYRFRSPMGWLSGLMKGKMKSTLEKGLNGLAVHLS